MAARTVRRRWVVVDLLLVARQAQGALRFFHLAVSRVTLGAFFVATDLVHAREIFLLMARGALRGERCRARPVGTMAVGAIALELTVRRVRLLLVTVRTRCILDAAGMRLVAIGAARVPFGRQTMLCRVARSTLDHRLLVVGIVAAQTISMSGHGDRSLVPVTGRAGLVEPLRVMRNPTMTRNALLMSAV